MPEIIDKNILKNLICNRVFPKFEIALMMKSKTSKVAIKPQAIKESGAFVLTLKFFWMALILL